MKAINRLSITSAICLLGWSQALAQFSSGSTGADGPLNVTSNTTLNLPPDGIFNFTTITISDSAALTFNRNPLNTPVYMLATGDVIISGIIDVSGKRNSGAAPGAGGPGGFDGGFGAFQGYPEGDGQGPGGGMTGNPYESAAFAFPSSSNSNIYGNTLLSPLIGGSGGAAKSTTAGGGGGGAILLASSTRLTINSGGRIDAFGGIGWGAGSGGAIRLLAPIVDGAGSLRVPGGGGQTAGASDGRTRIDSTNRFASRNLTLSGKATRGTQMVVFPPNNPHLDIIHAAGRDITEGTNAAITITLPIGASTNQIVRVQARGFTGDIPIRVKITPENAPSATYDTIITNTANPSVGEVTVTLPLETATYVHAWTR